MKKRKRSCTLAERIDTSNWGGSNHTPACTVEAIQLCHDFWAKAIHRELAAAKQSPGLTTLRVSPHHFPYIAETDRFLANDQFLTVRAKPEIRPRFVFFGDRRPRTEVKLESEPAVRGAQPALGRLQDEKRTEENLTKLKCYIQDTVAEHRNGSRALWGETFHEPTMALPHSVRLRKLGYHWIEELKPSQLVVCCWTESRETRNRYCRRPHLQQPIRIVGPPNRAGPYKKGRPHRPRRPSPLRQHQRPYPPYRHVVRQHRSTATRCCSWG